MKEETYANKIYLDEKTCFIKQFHKEWIKFLQSFHFDFSSSAQLRLGNRLRPILCCWGYALHSKNIKYFDYNDIMKLSVSIESIHKSSIIIDDLIDQDSQRRGSKSFHIEHGIHEAILFTLLLLIESIKNINNLIDRKKLALDSQNVNLNMYLSIICDMINGALIEVSDNEKSILNIKKVNKIINLETVSLIKKSLSLGYSFNNHTYKNIKDINLIGHNLGYIFQLLNDIEPYYDIENENYKGNKNIDVCRSRKNIVISYLNKICSRGDRKRLESFINNYNTNPESNFKEISLLLEKYKIVDLLFSDIKLVYNDILKAIDKIESSSINLTVVKEFKAFIKYMITYAINRLNQKNCEKFKKIVEI